LDRESVRDSGGAKGDEQPVAADELVRVGYVSGPHGIRGALRVRLDNPDSILPRYLQRLTLARNGETAEYRVTSAQSAGRGTYKIILEGISGFEDAAAQRGAIAMVPAAALPATGPKEFYYFQAVGCEILTTEGVRIGVIEEVFSNGANEVWVVRDRSAEHLLPVIEDVVKRIDLAARRVIIEVIPGLLDGR
jgi:16S rRNA processing protein RimM